ncbi:MAG: NYN domain-containing protein [Planctomycetota bacterium]
MKTYLIDGCNYVLKKLVDNKIHLNAGIKKLVVILNELKKKTKDEFIVFIDGDEETFLNKELKNNVLCIFSSKASTADAMIIDYIKNNPAKNYAVVTDDNRLRAIAKNFKVRLLHCNEFTLFCKKALPSFEQENEQLLSITDYIFFKQNPIIPDDEVEKQYLEFIHNNDENIEI